MIWKGELKSKQKEKRVWILINVGYKLIEVRRYNPRVPGIGQCWRYESTGKPRLAKGKIKI